MAFVEKRRRFFFTFTVICGIIFIVITYRYADTNFNGSICKYMNESFPEAARASVFYCRKQLDNSTVFECCVAMMPLREHHCCTYNFMLTLTSQIGLDCESVSDVTTDINEAERIFDTLCRCNVYPCHLFEVVSDLIA